MPVQETNIVWTDYSANLWKGCAKVSEGCKHCWAAGMADRFDRTPDPWTIENIDANLSVYEVDMTESFSVKRPGWCFYPSSSDPFLPWLEWETRFEYIHSIWENEHLCFQLLTKWGPEADRSQQEAYPDAYEPTNTTEIERWPPNVILGVSVESPLRRYRIDWLREQPAHTKFVSFEPLIERIPSVDLSGIDWIIVGGESYRNDEQRRDMDPEWAAHLYDLAREQDVAFLFKQHSGLYAEQDRTLDVGNGPEQFNEFPETPSGVPDAPREFR